MANIVALGGSIESLPIIRRIRDLGHRVIVIDGNPNAPAFSLADRCGVASCYHSEPTIRELKIIDEKYDACLCAGTDSPHVAAAVSAAFNLPGLYEMQAALGVDKWLQWNALFDNHIPVPMAYLFNDNISITSNKFWVIKPLDSRGARGVIRVPRGKGGGWHYIGELVNRSKQSSASGRVMVEEWLDGPQLSTESLVQDGKVLFTAVGLRNYARLEEFSPNVVEDGFEEPYDLPLMGENEANVDKFIESSCAALDWYQQGGGVVKGDLVIHNGELHVIELAPRLSGGLFCAAHELCYGVDFIKGAIQLALGQPIDPYRTHPHKYVSQRYIFPRPSDIGKTITAQEEGDYGAVFAHYSKSIGHVIQPVTSHPDRLGQALCVGASPQGARERAERAVRAMYGAMVIE